jgi:Flp pilus assembly protein TadG
MNLRGLMQRIRNSAAVRVLRDTRGAAAIEMGLIAPAMISFMFGTAELSTGVAVDRKVTITSRSLSDLVAQSTTISDSDMTNIFNAASSILTPYSTTPLHAKVTAVNIDASLNATVAWSSALNTSARAVGSTVTIPTGLKLANSQLIWAEVSYDFVPPVARFITGTLTLSDQFFARPRQSSTICRPPTVTVCS